MSEIETHVYKYTWQTFGGTTAVSFSQKNVILKWRDIYVESIRVVGTDGESWDRGESLNRGGGGGVGVTEKGAPVTLL